MKLGLAPIDPYPIMGIHPLFDERLEIHWTIKHLAQARTSRHHR